MCLCVMYVHVGGCYNWCNMYNCYIHALGDTQASKQFTQPSLPCVQIPTCTAERPAGVVVAPSCEEESMADLRSMMGNTACVRRVTRV